MLSECFSRAKGELGMEPASGIEPPTVAGSALKPASPPPTKGASPLVRSPRRGHTPFGTPRSVVRFWVTRSAVWSRRVGSNHRPAVYETAALPTELRRPSMSCEETGWIGRGIDGIILSTSITCQSSDSIRRCHLTRASGRVRTWAFASSGGTLIGSCSCPYSALAALGTCVRT